MHKVPAPSNGGRALAQRLSDGHQTPGGAVWAASHGAVAVAMPITPGAAAGRVIIEDHRQRWLASL